MIEPPVWVPKATGTMKSATAAADPLDDPPGVCAGLCGLAVGPGCAQRELGGHRLAEHHRAGLARERDAGRVLRRPVAGIESASRSAVGMSCGVDDVLDAERQAVQRSARARARRAPAPRRARAPGSRWANACTTGSRSAMRSRQARVSASRGEPPGGDRVERRRSASSSFGARWHLARPPPRGCASRLTRLASGVPYASNSLSDSPWPRATSLAGVPIMGLNRRASSWRIVGAARSRSSWRGRCSRTRRSVLRLVPQADLKILDTVQTTNNITSNHGYMIYDTLFSLDSKLEPQAADGRELHAERRRPHLDVQAAPRAQVPRRPAR